MTIYRLTSSTFKNDLSGTGASIYGGRWNSIGVPILYSAQHISLSLVELLVNFNNSTSPLKIKFYLLELELKNISPVVINESELKKNWKKDLQYTKFMGDEFISGQSHLVMQVPSSVVPEESNYLINPLHKDFKLLKVNYSKLYPFDERLLHSSS